MKKGIALVLVVLLSMGISGCSGKGDAESRFQFDLLGNYTGFENLPETYTTEQAEKDGCYVFVDSIPVAGEASWDRFVEKSAGGEDAAIRIAYFYDGTTQFQDLFHIDGFYRTFRSDSQDLKDHKYSMLLDVRGRLKNAAKDGRAVVITDDPTLTYVQVMFTFLSSDFHYRDTLSPFELVLIG